MNTRAIRGAKWDSDRLEYVKTRASITPEVLRLAAEGMTIRQLAARFDVSYVTCWRICAEKKKEEARECQRTRIRY
jgi:hypothetical protein